jgi:hypothetical protein
MYGFNDSELRMLKKLNTPIKIQDFLDSISYNFERDGETCMSPRRVLLCKKAHCMEGAMVAASALLLQGRNPLILSLKVTDDDYYHAVALYKENGYWGAISKTNHAVLRFRDPIYKTIRELALSYFHEYYLGETGKKTMRGYSKPVNLNQFGKTWTTTQEDLWHITETIYDLPHTPIVPPGNEKKVRKATLFERNVTDRTEWNTDGNLIQY